MEQDEDTTIEEIERLYPDEWVLVEETAWDGAEMPVRGRVLAHNLNRDELTQEIRQLAQQRPGIQLFSFYTGEKISGDVVPNLTNIEALVIELPRSLRIDGLLGVNFLGRFRSTFEFDSATLILRGQPPRQGSVN